MTKTEKHDDIFHMLVSIASRVHASGTSRSDILTDLASITPEQYKELGEGKFVPKGIKYQFRNCKTCGGHFFDNNMICGTCGEPNE